MVSIDATDSVVLALGVWSAQRYYCRFHLCIMLFNDLSINLSLLLLLDINGGPQLYFLMKSQCMLLLMFLSGFLSSFWSYGLCPLNVKCSRLLLAK